MSDAGRAAAWNRSGKGTKSRARKPKSKPVYRANGNGQEGKTGFRSMLIDWW